MKLRRRRIIRKAGIQRGVHLLPNLCTTASLYCGFIAIIKALEGKFVIAAWLILFAGLFDLFDGQIARLTKAGSQFGIEYDSLSDLASFGCAPAILMYMWALHDFKRLGAIIAFLFFVCGALRLARYNVQADQEEYRYFQGLPIPMAAYVLATTVLFHHWQYATLPEENFWVLGLVLVLSLFMVSTLRYRNAKEFHLRSRRSFFALVTAAAGIAFVAWKPPLMMWILSLAYVATGPLEEIYWLIKQGKRVENVVIHAKAPRAQQPITLVHSKEVSEP